MRSVARAMSTSPSSATRCGHDGSAGPSRPNPSVSAAPTATALASPRRDVPRNAMGPTTPPLPPLPPDAVSRGAQRQAADTPSGGRVQLGVAVSDGAGVPLERPSSPGVSRVTSPVYRFTLAYANAAFDSAGGMGTPSTTADGASRSYVDGSRYARM